MRRLLFPAGLLALLAFPATAPAPPGPTIGGTVTITGSEGKDEFTMTISDPGAPTVVIEPAVTITATSGAATCQTENDPQTGRPVRNHCQTGSMTLIMNLRGGDDNVRLQDEVGVVSSATINAGNGNDTVTASTRSGRAMNGEAGDDILRIPGQQSAVATTFDGGVGKDTAGYGSLVMATDQTVPISINANGSTNQVVLKRNLQNGTLQDHRTDPLTGIERLEGTNLGDIMTAGATLTELDGLTGPDNLSGGSLATNTILLGGSGLDNLTSGRGADVLDGGIGVDVYTGDSGDTFQMRDGYQERATCRTANTVVNDLTDGVDNPAGCSSISTAAAKHLRDTTLPQRRLRLSKEGKTAARVVCPAAKAEACEGRLALMLGKRSLGSRTYRLAPGKTTLLRFDLSKRQRARALGKKIDLVAAETDSDNRPRSVVRRVPARRLPR